MRLQQAWAKLQPAIKMIQSLRIVSQSLKGIRLRDIVGYSLEVELTTAVVALRCQVLKLLLAGTV